MWTFHKPNFLKPLNVHEHTPQMQTYCERITNYGMAPLKGPIFTKFETSASRDLKFV